MKISSREDVEAPIDQVFSVVSDFSKLQDHMQRRGVEIVEDATGPEAGVGHRWSARFTWRGRARELDAELAALEPGQGYTINSHSSGVSCTTVVDLVALSKTRTRILVSLDLRPTTLSSRLLVQSLKLAKGKLTNRLKQRMGVLARRIESANG